MTEKIKFVNGSEITPLPSGDVIRCRGWSVDPESFFEGLSREDFIQLLEEAGFEVEDGDGRIIDGNGKDITDEMKK